MGKYQVWTKDNYGRNEIQSHLGLFNDAATAIKAARKYAHEKNYDNALTFDEQKRHVSHAVVEVGGDAFYAGALIQGKPKVITAAEKSETLFDKNTPVQFYLGQTPRNEPSYLSDMRNRPITSLQSPELQQFTIVFIRPL
jgi:hypothetical protein